MSTENPTLPRITVYVPDLVRGEPRAEMIRKEGQVPSRLQAPSRGIFRLGLGGVLGTGCRSILSLMRTYYTVLC